MGPAREGPKTNTNEIDGGLKFPTPTNLGAIFALKLARRGLIEPGPAGNDGVNKLLTSCFESLFSNEQTHHLS